MRKSSSHLDALNCSLPELPTASFSLQRNLRTGIAAAIDVVVIFTCLLSPFSVSSMLKLLSSIEFVYQIHALHTKKSRGHIRSELVGVFFVECVMNEICDNPGQSGSSEDEPLSQRGGPGYISRMSGVKYYSAHFATYWMQSWTIVFTRATDIFQL